MPLTRALKNVCVPYFLATQNVVHTVNGQWQVCGAAAKTFSFNFMEGIWTAIRRLQTGRPIPVVPATDESDFMVHVFRERNSLADCLANKARQAGNCFSVENVEVCNNLIFHMDGSHTEESTGLGVILHGHNLDIWHDELPESSSKLICWVG